MDGQKIVDRHISEDVKERLDSSSLSPPSGDALVNLEFTLGRPSWQLDSTESSHEFTLLKCWSISQSNWFASFNYEEMDEWIIWACYIFVHPPNCSVISLQFLSWLMGKGEGEGMTQCHGRSLVYKKQHKPNFQATIVFFFIFCLVCQTTYGFVRGGYVWIICRCDEDSNHGPWSMIGPTENYLAMSWRVAPRGGAIWCCFQSFSIFAPQGLQHVARAHLPRPGLCNNFGLFVPSDVFLVLCALK